MAARASTVLILGAGSNVGQHVARAFADKGYTVASVARSVNEAESTSKQIYIKGDLSNPNSIADIFSKVKAAAGLPSVVVYNAAAATMVDPKDPLAGQLNDFSRDLTINTVSAFAAAQQAVLAFEQLPDPVSKTFIYTGNATNTMIIPQLLSLGVGKSGTAHLIEVAASAYQDRGFRFYYADERNADGSPAFMKIDGEAHGKYYLELAEDKARRKWSQTFVKGIGYKDFTGAR